MPQKKARSVLVIAAAAVALAGMNAASASRTLSAEEVKTLITDKTVHVTRKHDGKQWKIFFAPDGRGYEKADAAAGTWEVRDNGEHCVTWAKLRCARIADLGNGQYARLKGNGDVAVTWTRIEDGKKL